MPETQEEKLAEEIKEPVDLIPPAVERFMHEAYFRDPLTGQPSMAQGRPQSQQELDFINQYWDVFNTAPTGMETGQFMASQHPFERGSDINFLPGSTMANMGFGNVDEYFNAQAAGEPYGPHGGSEIPGGGLVVTDASGNPVMRYMDPNRVPQGYLNNPQYQITLGRQPQPAFQTPGYEDVLQGLPPPQVYGAKLYDYLQGLLEQDTPQLNYLRDQQQKLQMQDAKFRLDLQNQVNAAMQELEGRGYDPATLDSVVKDIQGQAEQYLSNWEQQYGQTAYDISATAENLMTGDKANRLLDEAENILKRGGLPEELPLYEQFKDIMGPKTSELAQGKVESQRTAAGKAQPKPFGGYATESVTYPTGQEKTEFDRFVLGLNVNQTSRQWLTRNYQDLYTAWRQELQQNPFISFSEWLYNYLGG